MAVTIHNELQLITVIRPAVAAVDHELLYGL